MSHEQTVNSFLKRNTDHRLSQVLCLKSVLSKMEVGSLLLCVNNTKLFLLVLRRLFTSSKKGIEQKPDVTKPQ